MAPPSFRPCGVRIQKTRVYSQADPSDIKPVGVKASTNSDVSGRGASYRMAGYRGLQEAEGRIVQVNLCPVLQCKGRRARTVLPVGTIESPA